MTKLVCRLLFAPTLMVAFATLVKGYAEAGDGFAAGVIAGLAFLMQFVAFGERHVRRALHTQHAPAVAVIGLAVALGVTLFPLLFGLPVLTHLPPPGAPVIHFGRFEAITGFVFDVGVFMLVLGFAVTALTLVARAESRDAP